MKEAKSIILLAVVPVVKSGTYDSSDEWRDEPLLKTEGGGRAFEVTWIFKLLFWRSNRGGGGWPENWVCTERDKKAWLQIQN